MTAGVRTAWCVLFVVAVLLPLGSTAMVTASAKRGVCEAQGKNVLGVTPVRVGKGVSLPRKTRHVHARLPDLPDGPTVTGMWVAEVLIDQNGNVARIWPIREAITRPAFQAFNEAFWDAVRQWSYEPTLVRGHARSLCLAAHWDLSEHRRGFARVSLPHVLSYRCVLERAEQGCGAVGLG